MTPRDFARTLRRQPSSAERALWKMLRDRRFAAAKFRRQHPIGPYIADFACVARTLVVEVDGPSHSIDAQIAHDEKRSAFLNAEAWRVLRLRDVDLSADPTGAAVAIVDALAQAPSP